MSLGISRLTRKIETAPKTIFGLAELFCRGGRPVSKGGEVCITTHNFCPINCKILIR